MEQQSRTESGNVAFLILIAVALFAALSFALTRDRSGNTSLMTEQQAKIAAQEIIAYGDAMTAAMQQLRLRGCADNAYDFSTNAWTDASGTVLTPAGFNPTAASGCSIFTDGKLNAVIFPDSYLVQTTGTKQGHSIILRYAFPNVGSTAGDLILRTVGIKVEICKKINDILGVTNPNGLMPTIGGGTTTKYAGTFNSVSTWTDPDGVLSGKMAFCGTLTPSTSTNGSFYQVIYAR